MIHKNDILMFTEVIDKNDDRRVMIAIEDEYVYDDPELYDEWPNKVKVGELNTWTPLGSTRVLESDAFKVVGHAGPNETKEDIVKRLLPEDKWEFTLELYRKNN